MPKSRAQKATIVKALTDKLADAQTVVFANFHGLPIAATDELRQTLKTKQVGYQVVKKTLLRLAVKNLPTPPIGDWPELDGEVAMAYLPATTAGADLISPAKGLADFGKKHKDLLAILGGIFEGRFIPAAEMRALAAIPDRDALLGMFVNVINSPIQGLVIALDQLSKKLTAQTSN